MNSPEKLSSAGTTPNKQVRGADRPSDHRGWPPEQPWLKVRTGVAKSPDTCGSHAGIYTPVQRDMGQFGAERWVTIQGNSKHRRDRMQYGDSLYHGTETRKGWKNEAEAF